MNILEGTLGPKFYSIDFGSWILLGGEEEIQCGWCGNRFYWCCYIWEIILNNYLCTIDLVVCLFKVKSLKNNGQTRSHRNGSCLMRCWELEVKEGLHAGAPLFSSARSHLGTILPFNQCQCRWGGVNLGPRLKHKVDEHKGQGRADST